jgi:hypothetical protein
MRQRSVKDNCSLHDTLILSCSVLGSVVLWPLATPDVKVARVY